MLPPASSVIGALGEGVGVGIGGHGAPRAPVTDERSAVQGRVVSFGVAERMFEPEVKAVASADRHIGRCRCESCRRLHGAALAG